MILYMYNITLYEKLITHDSSYVRLSKGWIDRSMDTYICILANRKAESKWDIGSTSFIMSTELWHKNVDHCF